MLCPLKYLSAASVFNKIFGKEKKGLKQKEWRQHSSAQTSSAGLKECLLGWKALSTAESLEQKLSLVSLSVLPHREYVTWNSAGDESGLCAGFSCSCELTDRMGRTFLS